ncbi:uncharacterized protein LOC141686669 [Apium graveolens]|uniref:uncharacterized protein LOC141686669 n=1 Tax=Apium graveolens TaxID=4045 RepID=UPI003D7B1A0A
MNLGQRTTKQMERPKKIMKKREDRISTLKDTLIHGIFSFLDSRLAVQTSIISKRWKLIWTTLPYLNLYKDVKFIETFLSRRNNDSKIKKLNISLGFAPPTYLVNEFVGYAIRHNVKVINVDVLGLRATIRFSTFTSTSVKNLTLTLNFDRLSESDCWNLPALTNLHLIHYPREPCKLPESYLICLPSLQTLLLDRLVLPESITLPALKTLGLRSCTLPRQVWDLPALLTLKLDDVAFPEDTSEFFSALINLRNLIMSFRKQELDNWVINCPELENLTINVEMSTASHGGDITVLSRKICNFSAVGYFPITFEDSQLKHVDIKLWDSTKYKSSSLKVNVGTYHSQLTDMFSGLGRARTLTLDMETIKVLSSVSDWYVGSPSPFYNLKYVRIPPGYRESSMSTYLKSYLLGNSPKAAIVTTCPKTVIPQAGEGSVTAQNVVMEDTLESPTKVLVSSENIQKTVCIDTMEEEVQEEQVMQNSEPHTDMVRDVSALLEETCNDPVSSFGGTSDSGLWQGYGVNPDFVCLLDQITIKYPGTFEHLTATNKKFYEMKLNMLCSSVIDFTKIPLTEVDAEMIADYRDIFADLQKLGFNVSWLVNRLNYIERLHFSQPLRELHAIDLHIDDAKSKLQDLQIRIDDAKIKLQDLHTLRAEKMQEAKKPAGTMGVNLAAGYAGYDLLSGP